MTPLESDPGDEQPDPREYEPSPWSYRLWPGRRIVFEGATLKVETINGSHVVLSHVSGSTVDYHE